MTSLIRILTLVVLMSTTASAKTGGRDVGQFYEYWDSWCDQTVTTIDLGIDRLNKSLNRNRAIWTSKEIDILHTLFARINPPPSPDLGSQMSALIAKLWDMSELVKEDVLKNGEPFKRSQITNIYGHMLMEHLKFIRNEIQSGDHFFFPLMASPWMTINSHQEQLLASERRYLDFYIRILRYLNQNMVVLGYDQMGDMTVSSKMTPRAYIVAAQEIVSFVSPSVRQNLNGSMFGCVLNRLNMFMEETVSEYMTKTDTGEWERDLQEESDLVHDTYKEIQAVIDRQSTCHLKRW